MEEPQQSQVIGELCCSSMQIIVVVDSGRRAGGGGSALSDRIDTTVLGRFNAVWY
jgi:hypothetical protein